MKFFREMTFAKGMILICLLGAVVLAPLISSNHKKIVTLTNAVVKEGGELAKLVARIQSNSLGWTQLYEKKSGEFLQGQGRTTEYILKVAGDDSVDLGRINLPRPVVNELTGGIVDETFAIKPDEADHPFDRVRIGNFLFSLEDRTRRLRVTQLVLEALNEDGKRRVKPEDFPSDKWAFSCKVTSRRRRASE